MIPNKQPQLPLPALPRLSVCLSAVCDLNSKVFTLYQAPWLPEGLGVWSGGGGGWGEVGNQVGLPTSHSISIRSPLCLEKEAKETAQGMG